MPVKDRILTDTSCEALVHGCEPTERFRKQRVIVLVIVAIMVKNSSTSHNNGMNDGNTNGNNTGSTNGTNSNNIGEFEVQV